MGRGFESPSGLLATTDTTQDALFHHRIAMMEERGFSASEALTLVEASKSVISKSSNGCDYVYQVPLSWHDVARLQEAGASNEQVLRILT
jgi:hypothetical protein